MEARRQPTGTIFAIQRFCLHDGPGIRTTVFLKGCPLACPWCHNPEGRDADPEVWFLDGRCIRCGACVEACPVPPSGPAPAVDPARCVRCGACVEACPTGAREWTGRTVSAEECLREAVRDRPFFAQSGGGVTFSGGEPLLQAGFLLDCLRSCRERGLHAAVDTCGYAPREVLLEAASVADLFLFDLKLVDDARHRDETGVAAQPILDNLIALDASGAEIWIRVPLVPGFNDNGASLAAIGQAVLRLERTRRIHLLPYHRIGESKHGRLGLRGPEHRRTPTADAARTATEGLSALGLDVRIGG